MSQAKNQDLYGKSDRCVAVFENYQSKQPCEDCMDDFPCFDCFEPDEAT